uniref:Translocator protein 2 n=2 Tax=Rattus norvegicus TaxID=10116 RepID=A0A8I6G7V7_RAT
MQLQGPVFVGVPLLGPILIWMFTHQLSSRCEDEKKLPWCPPHKVILLVWATIYSVMGPSWTSYCSMDWWQVWCLSGNQSTSWLLCSCCPTWPGSL